MTKSQDLKGREGGPPPQDSGPPPREPAFKAPAPVVVLTLALVGLYTLQGFLGGPDAAVAEFGFSPADLAEGRWTGLVTALFVHGGWTHVLMNAGWALAFGPPVARLFGRGVLASAGFMLFFLICGVAGNLAFAAVHPMDDIQLVGASGAVSGLMGAASRLIERRNRIASFASRTVVVMAVLFVIVNVVIGVVGLDAVSGGAAIAWEAHLGGYAAGLLLIGPAAWLSGGSTSKL
jgi:membrane associated rhomboid family serine protease